jgi:hypothetical protein
MNRSHLEVLAVRLDWLDPIGWSDRATTVVLGVWVGTLVFAALVLRIPMAIACLPILGFVRWRSDGNAVLPTVLWTVPLAVALALATVLPDPPRTGALVVLVVLGAALTLVGGARRVWLSVFGSANPVLVETPVQARALQQALAPVNHALNQSLHDRDARRVKTAVTQARAEIAALQIPESDPWHEAVRLAALWLRDIDAIASNPTQSAAAYAAANRRARQLRRAELVLVKRTRGRPPGWHIK